MLFVLLYCHHTAAGEENHGKKVANCFVGVSAFVYFPMGLFKCGASKCRLSFSFSILCDKMGS